MASKREILNLKRLELIKARAAAKAIASNPVVAQAVPGVVPGMPAALDASVEIPCTATVEAITSVMAVQAGDGSHVAVNPPQNAQEGQRMGEEASRLAKIYARPINVRMRLIEFEDGSHGRLWVKPDAAPMLSWKVWVKPSPNVKGDWEIHGRYNARGTRLQ